MNSDLSMCIRIGCAKRGNQNGCAMKNEKENYTDKLLLLLLLLLRMSARPYIIDKQTRIKK